MEIESSYYSNTPDGFCWKFWDNAYRLVFKKTAFVSLYDWLRDFGRHLLSIIWKLIAAKFEFLIWENFKIIMKLMSKMPKIKFTSISTVQMAKIVRSGRFLLYQGSTDESGRHLTWKPWKFWIPWYIRCQLSCTSRHISRRSDWTRKRNEFSRRAKVCQCSIRPVRRTLLKENTINWWKLVIVRWKNFFTKKIYFESSQGSDAPYWWSFDDE